MIKILICLVALNAGHETQQCYVVATAQTVHAYCLAAGGWSLMGREPRRVSSCKLAGEDE